MANLDHKTKKVEYISLSRAEALEIITLLTSHLANSPPIGRSSGACADVNVFNKGVVIKRLVLSVDINR